MNILENYKNTDCCLTLTNGQKIVCHLGYNVEENRYTVKYSCEVVYVPVEGGMAPVLQPWQPFIKENEVIIDRSSITSVGSMADEMKSIWKKTTGQVDIFTPPDPKIELVN